MRVIEHRHRVAAVALDRVHYAAHIEVLEPDHPERRFVAALCLYSHAVTADRPASGSTTKGGRALRARC
jgi:hypothetical protein